MAQTAQFPKEQSETGAFERQEDAFREWVSDDSSTPHPVTANRYHLLFRWRARGLRGRSSYVT
jgi:glutathionyl-hydroquinone reductase